MKKFIVLSTLFITFIIRLHVDAFCETTDPIYILKEEHEINKGVLIVRLYLENYGQQKLEENIGLYMIFHDIQFPPSGVSLPIDIIRDEPNYPIPAVQPHSKEFIGELYFLIDRNVHSTATPMLWPEEPTLVNPYIDIGNFNPEYLRSNTQYLMKVKVGRNIEGVRGGQVSNIINTYGYDDTAETLMAHINKQLGPIKNSIEEFRSHFEYRYYQLDQRLRTIIRLLRRK